MIKLFNKYKESILYLIFGALTTLINILTYYVFTDIWGVDFKISNIIAWIIAVLFAFVTNKIYVFNSKSFEPILVIKELSNFILYRLLTGLLDMAIMWISVDYFHFDDMIMKILSNIIVIVLNYVFSKLIIFKKQS